MFRRRIAGLAAVQWILGAAASLSQPYVPLYEGPTYDGASGYINPSFNGEALYEPESSWALLNNAGIAAWTPIEEPVGDRRAIRWNPLSGTPLELMTSAGSLGNSHARSINAAGTVAGYTHVGPDQRAARWDAGSAAPTLLPGLFPNAERHANGINDAGTIVGYSDWNDGFGDRGQRAVRWDSAGNITELQNLSFDSLNRATAEAYSINNSGQVVGRAIRFGASNANLGFRAVRWDSAGNVAELDHLGISASGAAEAASWAINASGSAVGFSERFIAGQGHGDRAVRWNAGTTTAIELELLGSTDVPGLSTHSRAYTLNDAGTAVGWALKYSTHNLGNRAVLWDTSGNATELDNLGTSDEGVTHTEAYDVNEAGIAVGTAHKWVDFESQGQKAVYWRSDGTAVDLNTLVAPSAEWTLTTAYAITETGWIAGVGMYDPPGDQGVYERVFMLQLPIATVDLAGDYNDDDKVDAADYVVWRKHLGSTTITLPNDTSPGSVLQVDYNVWRENFGRTSGAGSSSLATHVPEPAGIALLAVAGWIVPVQRLRRIRGRA